MASRADAVAVDFALAAQHVVPLPDAKPWTNGWAYEAYRRSGGAAIDSGSGPVTITADGLPAWERAVSQLLREPAVQQRWDDEELWGLMASMTVAAAESKDALAFVTSAVRRVRSIGPAFVALLIANVAWHGPPQELSGMVVGAADEAFFELARTLSAGRVAPTKEQSDDWLARVVTPRVADSEGSVPVAIGRWSPGQALKAREDAERNFEDLIGLSLLLEPDLPAHGIFRRGPTNRPGVRGLTLDRGAIESGLDGAYRLELASFPLVVNDLGLGQAVEWYSSEPLPLEAMLSRPDFSAQVASCFQDDPLSRRLRVAARWFAEAQYASADDDATLALGVAMDALLSGKHALPGSAMADRFAMLEADPAQRSARVRTHLELYKARSSVAHGGVSNAATSGMLRRFFAEAQWAANRVIALRDWASPVSEADVKACFDELRWSARNWPAR
jgi:Apea-like HEPN